MISKRRIKQLIELSKAKNITIAGAESCTGGLVSSLITMIPGSSSAFLGSVVSYANSAKAEILGVPKDILASHGAVSEACAQAMALGAQRLFAADLVFSITGIAGPSGGTDEKPVGTVWFSLQYKNESRAWVRHFPGWRRRIQKLAAAEILGNMLAMLQNLT